MHTTLYRRGLLIGLFLTPVLHYAQTVRSCPMHLASHSPTVTADGRRASDDVDQVIAIPVVVHILYAEAEQNISTPQIISQLTVLNADYNRQNTDAANTLSIFQPVAATCNLKFYLATEDPDGHATSGILRIATPHGPFANNDIHYTKSGGSDAWDPQRYLNVWVANLADGVLGYGNPPGTDAATDGVVIDYAAFGTTGTATAPYHLGRTATHEVGHWLGLLHPWGIAGGCNDDDGIDDTPPQQAAATGCNLDQYSCDSQDMTQNFMNLSNDACMNLFTTGQKAVMRATLFQHRPGVIQDPSVITATADPEATPLQIYHPGPGVIHIQSSTLLQHLQLADVTGRAITFQLTETSSHQYIVSYHAPGTLVILVIRTGTTVTARKFWE